MRELNQNELSEVDGGKQLLNLISGAIIGGVIEGTMGLFVAGPAGFAAGFIHGVIDGLGVAAITENANGLVDTLHPNMQ